MSANNAPPGQAERKGLRYALAGSLGHALASALLATVRFTTRQAEHFHRFAEQDEPVLFALWHGRLLPLSYFHRHRNIAAMISQSQDGEYIARIASGWGIDPVRGSSSRGGREALRQVTRRIRAGQSVAITPDGPRGPRQQLQPGVIAAAQLTGAPIIPLAAGCSSAWWPGGWDRFCVPRPFSRVTVLYGEPHYVPRKLDEHQLQDHVRTLENGMNAMIAQVDELAGCAPPGARGDEVGAS